MSKQYVIGLDFGSDSVRALLANAYSGEEIAHEVCFYPRWQKMLYSNPAEQQFRHHPLDYIESMTEAIAKLTKKYKDIASDVVALAMDTTASTPVFVDEHLTPLSLTDKYKEDPDAMFILWKDHTAWKESNEINEALQKSQVNYAREMGNYYTPEGYWAKVLHILRTNKNIRKDAYSCIELCDYLPALLTGCTNMKDIKCGHCIAGVKMMYSVDWNGFPPENFFKDIDPLLIPILKTLPKENYTCDTAAGKLTKEWAKKLGLNEGILIGVGNVDSHSGGVGGGVCYGFGAGLVFKSGFTTGGTDILNQIISKYFKTTIGKSMLMSDGLIVCTSAFIFGPIHLMYSIIVLYIVSLLSDKVILGISDNKAFYIITDEEEKVKDYILKYLSHGVTIIKAKGGYLGEKENVLMCVLPTKDYYKLTEGIKEIDKDAFFLVTDAYEVFGGD